MKHTTHSFSRRAFAASGLAALATLGLSRLSLAQAARGTQAAGGAAPSAGAQGPTTSGKALPPEVERANIAVVTAFCDAFVRKDAAKAASLLNDNCTYRIVQDRPPIVGKEKVAAQIKGLMERGAEFKTYKSVALGPLVLNDRDDVLQRPTGTLTVRLAGFFFVENGKISEWTDYVVR